MAACLLPRKGAGCGAAALPAQRARPDAGGRPGCSGGAARAHGARAQERGWAGAPTELLVEVVALLGPRDARAMHRVCLAWRGAVRAGVRRLAPVSPKFAAVRDLFPAVRGLRPGRAARARRAALAGRGG